MTRFTSYLKKNSENTDWNYILENVHKKLLYVRNLCDKKYLICCFDLTSNGEKGFFDLFGKTQDNNFFIEKQKGYCFYNFPKIRINDQTNTEPTDIINLIFAYLFLNSSNKSIKSIFFLCDLRDFKTSSTNKIIKQFFENFGYIKNLILQAKILWNSIFVSINDNDNNNESLCQEIINILSKYINEQNFTKHQEIQKIKDKKDQFIILKKNDGKASNNNETISNKLEELKRIASQELIVEIDGFEHYFVKFMLNNFLIKKSYEFTNEILDLIKLDKDIEYWKLSKKMAHGKDRYFDFQEKITGVILNDRDNNCSKITELSSKINELEEKVKIIKGKIKFNKNYYEFILEASQIYSFEHESFKNLKRLIEDNPIFIQEKNIAPNTGMTNENDDQLSREDFLLNR